MRRDTTGSELSRALKRKFGLGSATHLAARVVVVGSALGASGREAEPLAAPTWDELLARLRPEGERVDEGLGSAAPSQSRLDGLQLELDLDLVGP